MPAPDQNWPIADRARWLQAFAMNLSLIYGADKGDVQVTARPAHGVRDDHAQEA
jgi:hypothetical protein